MPKVQHIKKARKDYPPNIQRGESYYKWQFRFGPVMRSKTYPKPQQLTQSEFWIVVYDIKDELDALSGAETISDLREQVGSIVDNIRNLASEQEDKLYNMPDGLQQGDVGQLLQDRQSDLEAWADEIEATDLEIDEEKEEDESEEEREERVEEEIQTIIDELQMIEYSGS